MAILLTLLVLLVLSPARVVPTSVASVPPSSIAVSLPGFKYVGEAPQSLPVLATIAIPLRNMDSLDSLVMQVSDPSSPSYRHFLTPQQVKQRFLPTTSFNSMMRYIATSGLHVEMTALDSVIVVEGTAQQVAASLHTSVDLYSNGTFSYYVSRGPPTFEGAYVYASNATFLFTKPAVSSSGQTSANVTFTGGGFSAKELQRVYNATSLYSKGYDGSGETIGILDFYGSPTITSDLKAFDKSFGFPDPSFSIIPIGPYDPNIGVSLGWSSEVSIDVESAHAMAPRAAVDLYVANGALSWSAAVAKVVNDDTVTDLSQSFGIPEWYFSLSYYLGGPAFLTMNVLLSDQYYALGSVEGISFLASSGDAGGSGYSSGPEGSVEYPSSSPFVTSVGGTQTYFSQGRPGAQSFRQVAWSNQGFVPNLVNEGGSGGGVSILEPRPWYQQQQSAPASFPNGRLTPDLSLQAGVSPATLIVDSGNTVQTGGTSESSPLLAGLLTLMAESSGGKLGLINPFLYKVGNEPSSYAKGYQPITSGYTIPWTASYGYNLATGWGAPNVGGLSGLLNASRVVPSLDISGMILNSSGRPQLDYTQGQTLNVVANITYQHSQVTTGFFSLSLQTLEGILPSSPLAYDPATGNWTGSIVMGQQSGLATVLVSGSSDDVSGEAMGSIFAGYLGTITVAGSAYIVPVDPWTWGPSDPLTIQVYSTDLNGFPAPAQSIQMNVEPYSISANNYTTIAETTLSPFTSGWFQGNLSTATPAGPISLVLGGGTYSYAPAVSGIYLQTTYVFPEVAAEPGSVAPGQSLTIITTPIAPANVFFLTSYETGRVIGEDVETGSNVTATLLDPVGRPVSNASLVYQPCAQALRVCGAGADVLNGYLQVPSNASPGLYTVMINASYASYTLNRTLYGSFFGQVLVSGKPTTPRIEIEPSTLYEGQTARIVADITYRNGTEVRYGIYTAVIYPKELQGDYTRIMHMEFASSDLIPLSYDAALDRWVGNFSLPSPYAPGALAQVSNSSLYYAGPYDAFVTGLSYDGVPTATNVAAQKAFFVQPYVYATGEGTVSSAQTSGIAFAGATLIHASILSGDVFVGTNTIANTNVTISTSQILGTLVARNAHLTLVGVSGGDISADNSTIVLDQSKLNSLELTGSTVALYDSTYSSVSPSLPTITVTSPVQGRVYNGSAFGVNVTGSDVSAVAVYLDGVLLATMQGNATHYSYPISPNALEDGIHTVMVVATQSDGLSSTASVTFSTNARQAAEMSAIYSLQKQLQNENAAINSLKSLYASYVVLLGVLGAAALATAGYALVRSRRR